MKKVIITFLSAAVLMFAAHSASAAGHGGDKMTPHSVIHVVTVSWKEDATEKQIQAALDGVVTLGKEYDGITRVWIKTIKAQGERSHAFVMEFKDEKALEDYAGSDAQQKWYEVYIPVRDVSRTFDITN